MDTAGHHKALKEGAEDRLMRAFAENGHAVVNLQPLFLGNWLADLSQLKDPRSKILAAKFEDLTNGIRAKVAPIQARFAAGLKEALAAARAHLKIHRRRLVLARRWLIS